MREEFYRLLQLLNTAQSNYVDALKNDAPVPVRNQIWKTIQQLAEEMMTVYHGLTSTEQIYDRPVL